MPQFNEIRVIRTKDREFTVVCDDRIATHLYRGEALHVICATLFGQDAPYMSTYEQIRDRELQHGWNMHHFVEEPVAILPRVAESTNNKPVGFKTISIDASKMPMIELVKSIQSKVEYSEVQYV